MSRTIPFNAPHLTGKELHYIAEAHFNGRLAGDGPFTKRCHEWLEKLTGASKALLTHSCTAALEMSALLLDIQPGDEIIMPSFTFVSTANAFVLRGGVPVFVDIRPDTLNINEKLIEAAITPRTKAIVPVHYAGVSCEMDRIMEIASAHHLMVVEDAAQGLLSTYKGQPLGAIGHLGAYSFHETKNIISGEGGALIINESEMGTRAEIIREKGTNRSQFFRGQVDKYTWQEAGSSFLPSELMAAFLWAQFEEAEKIIATRLNIWNNYHELLKAPEEKSKLRRPVVPQDCRHNGHIYYVLLPKEADLGSVLANLKEQGIAALFHYVPLHSSPAGRRLGKVSGDMAVTDDIAGRLVRLPMWSGLQIDDQLRVVEALDKVL